MRFAVALLCVFFVATSAGSADATRAKSPATATKAVSLDALLARARIASGEPYRYHILSLTHETRGGRTFDVTTETQGLKYRARSCSNGLCSGFYFDGERSYDVNFNDTALPISARVDALQLTLRAIVSYAFTAANFRAQGGELREREPVLRDGRTYRRLAVAPFRGALLDAIVDPQTGLVAGIVSDERRYAFELRDQRRVGDRVTLPYEIALNGSVVQRFEKRSISPAPLEAPPGLVPTVSGENPPVAMRKVDRASDQPVVPCTVGGERATCLLDSGNSGLSMSAEFAEKLHLEPRGGAFDDGGVARYVTGIVSAPPLTVGAATYPSASYVVLHDLNPYGYDVVLGADAFAHARVTIDYPKRTVRISPATGATETPPANAISISFENFIPVTTVRLGETSVPLAIDTGDESSINLPYDFYAEHRAIFTPTAPAPGSAASDTSEQLVGTLGDVRLATYDIAQVKIGATRSLSATTNGHLGSGLLERFVATFDYGRGRVELASRSGDPSVRVAP